jgi:putative N6-adenine-specific DNA methylase
VSKRSPPASKPVAGQLPRGEKAGVRPAPSAVALLQCFAIVAPGLEPLALAEARAAGLPAELAEGGGGIAWNGDLRSVLLANTALRIVSRVIVRLAEFEARSFAELERHARQVPWASVVVPGSAVRFRVTSKKSKLYHSDAVAQRLADAVTRALPGVRAEGSSASDNEDVGENAQLFVVRLFRDRCTVSADTSGALLHRRGYRQATAKAPLRETLAAALIAASAWDVASPLVDPFCGSGTIPIEAALMALGRPPGALRTFAAERWPGVSRTLGERVRAELTASGATPIPPIRGYDRDAGAIEAALSNAQRAGVATEVALAVRSLSAAEFPAGGRGWVVTNPPYGVRVGDAERVRDLWAQLGHVLRQRAPGWRLALLSPDPALERQLGLPMRVVAQTSNGGIPVRLVVGRVEG